MRTYKLLGILGAVAAYPFILTAILLSPWFNFFNNALSDLGNVTLHSSTAWIFNTGLILAGILIAIFGAILTVKNKSWMYLAWTLPLTASGIDLALIGVFPENAGHIHWIVSVIFFSLTIITMLVYSYCSWPLNAPQIGAVALVFGIVSLIVWFVKWPWRGVAIQETSTCIMASICVILIARRL